MEIEINAEELKNALKVVSVAINPKIPILKAVHIDTDEQNEQVKITTTDTELSITATAKATIKKQGKACIDYQQLFNIANVSTKNILLTSKQNTLSITNINSNYELPLINFNEYPVISDISEIILSELNLSDFKNALNKISSATGQDNSKYVFTCILIDKNVVVATNGYRLSIAEINPNISISALVKEKFIRVIKQLNNDIILIGDNDNRIALKSDDVEVSVNKIMGNFPNYKQVLQTLLDYQHYMKCNKSDLINAIKSVCIDTDQNSQSIYMQAVANNLLISKQSKEQGTIANTTISCNHSIDFKMYLSYKSMIDILNTLDGDTAIIKIPDSEFDKIIEKAILIEDYNSKHVLMPFRAE